MRKKLFVMLLSAAMIMTSIAGCAKEREAKNLEEDQEGKKKVTLSIWTWDTNSLSAPCEAYKAEHPEVDFEVVAVEHGDMIPKMQRSLASDSELPVIVMLDNMLIENWKEMDICEDLTKYGFQKEKYIEEVAEQTVTEKGEVIGAEVNFCPAGIAYKRDLAKEYFGTDDPEKLFEIFNSYDAYVEKGAEVYEKSNGEVYLFHSAQAVAEWLYFANEIPNMEGNQLNYTEKMTDIMSILVQLRDVNAIDTYQNGTPEANATYADETHIFYPCPNWSPSYYIQGNDPEGAGNWGIMRAPVDYNHGGGAIGFTKTASEEEKQAAYDFIIWLTEGKGAEILRDTVGYIVPNKTFLENPEWIQMSEEMEAYFGGEDIGKLFYQEIAPKMQISTPSVWDSSVMNVRNDLAQLLVDDKEMTLEEAISIGKDQITQLVTDEDVQIK